VIVSIKTIDFPDARPLGTMAAMENSLYALETMLAERLTDARREARRCHLAALARPRRRPLRARLGETLIALGEWLRRGALAPQPS
jgi:hypothetical protein